jgi:pimeloyl-ACP methyl ester carboxylesterase
MRRFVKVLLWIVALLLLLLVVGPFLVPAPPLEGLSPPQELGDDESRFIAVPLGEESVTLHVKEAGSGDPALVLLHGFGASLFTWREIAGDLALNQRTIAFDRPAFGLTERPLRGEWGDAATWRAQSPYSPEAQVELTVGLMDELGIEQAVLVGNSAGGSLSMLTALTHPDRVEALILLDPAVYTGGGSPAWIRPLLQTPQASRLGPALARRIQAWGLDFAASSWHDPSRMGPEVMEGYQLPLQAEGWDKALFELTRASRPLNLDQRLGELTLPVLVITGDDDRIVPTEQSIRLAGELPDAELVVIPACGHVPQEECPEQTLEAINTFLSTLAERR